jgi:hypothetical protein
VRVGVRVGVADGVPVVGSPTQRFSPLPAVSGFLQCIAQDALRGVKVAALDTRFTVQAVERTRSLAFFARIFGYAAKSITDRLGK